MRADRMARRMEWRYWRFHEGEMVSGTLLGTQVKAFMWFVDRGGGFYKAVIVGGKKDVSFMPSVHPLWLFRRLESALRDEKRGKRAAMTSWCWIPRKEALVVLISES